MSPSIPCTLTCVCVFITCVHTRRPFLQGGQVKELTAPRNKVYLFKTSKKIIYLSIGNTVKLSGSEFLDQGSTGSGIGSLES